MADSADVDTPINIYETKDILPLASRAGLQAAGVGTFVSTVQNALNSHSRGAMGFLTRTGGTIGFFGAQNLFCLVYLNTYLTAHAPSYTICFDIISCDGIHLCIYGILHGQPATKKRPNK